MTTYLKGRCAQCLHDHVRDETALRAIEDYFCSDACLEKAIDLAVDPQYKSGTDIDDAQNMQEFSRGFTEAQLKKPDAHTRGLLDRIHAVWKENKAYAFRSANSALKTK